MTAFGGRMPRNRILANLPEDQAQRLEPHLELRQLEVRDLMFDFNQVIDAVWFPEDCVGSIIGVMADGSAVETATVGDEGMIGLPLFHGTDRMSSQAFCQVPGRAWRLPAEAFRSELGQGGQLVHLLHRYAQALFSLVAQSSACNRLHGIEKRCARWILLTQDRVATDRFSLTPQFLAQMLGAPRDAVEQAVTSLEQCFRYEGGIVTVHDRPELEGEACECYGIVRSEFDRLLPDHGGPPWPNPLEGLTTSQGGKSIVGAPLPDAGTDPD